MVMKSLSLVFLMAVLGVQCTEWQGVGEPCPGDVLSIRQVDNPGNIGDIYLVQAPDGTATLVDTGCPTTGESVLIPALEQFGVRRLKQIIITHQHTDHIGGLPALLADPEIDIGQILWAPIPDEFLAKYAPDEYRIELPFSKVALEMAARRDISVRELVLGESLDFGGGVTGKVIGMPRPTIEVPGYVNNNSVVFRLQYGDFSMLFTGDQQREEEEWLLGIGETIVSDVLKVGHHGGNGSTCPQFLDTVKPQVAMTTSPEWVATMPLVAEVTAMLKKRGIPYFPSWQFGTLTLWSNGNVFGIVLERK